MESIGFRHSASGRLAVFEHPDVQWFVEFVAAPLSFGALTVSADDCAQLALNQGQLRIVTPTQCVMDRLAAAFHWNDPQSKEQALQVAQGNEIDWTALERWFDTEGQSKVDFESFRATASG